MRLRETLLEVALVIFSIKNKEYEVITRSLPVQSEYYITIFKTPYEIHIFKDKYVKDHVTMKIFNKYYVEIVVHLELEDFNILADLFKLKE